AVLLVQALGAAPGVWTLLQRRRGAAGPAEGALFAGQAGPAAQAAPALPAPPTPASIAAQEAARVRTLIEQRGGADAPRLIVEVDRILKLIGTLADREADLEEQTSERERAE